MIIDRIECPVCKAEENVRLNFSDGVVGPNNTLKYLSLSMEIECIKCGKVFELTYSTSQVIGK